MYIFLVPTPENVAQYTGNPVDAVWIVVYSGN